MDRERHGESLFWILRIVKGFVGLSLAVSLVGCGGGSGGSNQTPPPVSPSFSIVATPSAPSIAPGSSSSFQVSITPQNGFNGQVAITISGLPTGLSAAPSTFSVQGAPQTVTLSAASGLANGNYSLSLNGTGGGLSSSANVVIGVGGLADFLVIQPLI